MKRILGLVIMTALVGGGGCKKKPDDGSGSGSGSGSMTTPMVDPSAKKCPPGNVLKADVCTPLITAEKVQAVAAQKTQLDNLAKLLDKADDVAAPIELLDAVRQLDEWKKLSATNSKFKAIEDIVAILGEAVKQLHAFQAGVKDGSIHLNNIRGELDAIMKDTGAARKIEDVQAQLGKELQAAVDGLTTQVVATIQKVMGPLKGQIQDVSDLLITACTIAKVSGGSDKLKDLCTKARDVFGKATTFLAELETKPQQIIAQLSGQLQAQLGDLVDAESKKMLDTAQQAVNDALKLPAGGVGSGSGSGSATPGGGSGSGSGSATP